MNAVREILLLRHAEETPDAWNPDLSARGQARADRLARFIPAEFGVPDLLVAAAPNRTSIRSYLTLRPLAQARGIPLYAALKSVQVPRVVRQLRAIPLVERRLVVVCWTHIELPNLARALGATAHQYPDPWSDGLFDIILRFRYARNGRPSVTLVQQAFQARR